MLMRLTDEREDDTELYEGLEKIAKCIDGLPKGSRLYLLRDTAPPGEGRMVGFKCLGPREGHKGPVWESMNYSVECHLAVNYGLGGGLMMSTWGLNRFPDGSPDIAIRTEDTETICGWWPDGRPLIIEKGVIVDADKTE